MISAKTHFNILLLGPRQSGKATTIGQLVLKNGNVAPLVIENFQQNSNNKYTWALNYLKEEREGGSNEQIPYTRFETQTKIFQITEAPVHQNFLKNLIAQGSRDQIGLVIISASTQENESELLPQLAFAKTLGIRQFIVCVNRLDEEKVAWSQSIFEDVQKRVSELFTSRGIDLASVSFVPISGLNGDNLFEKSSNLNWYTGKTLIDALENVSPFPKLKDGPLRIPLSDQYKISEVGTILSGRVESGLLKIGMTVSFSPIDIKATVRTFEAYAGGITDTAEAGDNMAFTIDGNPQKLTRGVVCGGTDNNAPKKISKSDNFEALVVVTSDLEQFNKGGKLTVDCHTAHFACQLQSIGVIYAPNGRRKEGTEALEVGDSAFLTLTPHEDVCVEVFADFPALGRFDLKGDKDQNVGLGIIKSINRGN